MSTIPEIAALLHTILTQKADDIARFNRFVRRRDKPLTGARFVQTLVFTLLGNPAAALSDYCHTAAALGTPLSPQGLDQNFTEPAADLLLQVLKLAAAATICAADPLAGGLLSRFSAVFVFDSSCIGLPPSLAQLWMGCGNGARPAPATSATLKLALGLELRHGHLCEVELLDGMVHDRLTKGQQAAVPAHAVRLTDLGFFSLERFAAISADDGYWFSRLQTGVVVFPSADQRAAVEELLADHAGVQYDQWVELGVDAHLPARLIAVRVTQAVADTRRRKLHAAARRKAQTVSARRLAGADWNVYVTNIPVAQLSVLEAVVLAGVRWQIERLFKLWKSHGQIDTWADSANPWRILSEIYAKLLAMVVSHWLIVVSCWANPARSWCAAAAVVRQYAAVLVSGWPTAAALEAALALIQRVIAATCHMGKRQKHPNTYQLLLHPELRATVGDLA